MVNEYSRDSKWKMNSLFKDYISEELNFSINFSPNPFLNDFKVEATKLNEPIRVSIFWYYREKSKPAPAE